MKALIVAFVFALACFQTEASAQKVPGYVAEVIGKPFKLSIRPSSRTLNVRQRVELVVSLLDGDGMPVNARADTPVRIAVTEPSGNTIMLKAKILRGKASDSQVFLPRAEGRHGIEATDEEGRLLSDKYSFFVLPFGFRRGLLAPAVAPAIAWLAAKPAAFEPPSSPPQPRPPIIFLELLARSEGVLADGKDAATILATYLSEDGLGAPKDMQIWFRRSHGDLDDRNLRIRKGEADGKLLWTSKWPVQDAAIEFIGTNPKCTVSEPKGFKTSFVRRVDGIAPIGPPSFSLTEKPTLTVWFVDHLGNMMRADKERKVTFSSSRTNVAVNPTEVSVPAGGGPITVTLSPLLPGNSVLQINSDDLRGGSVSFPIQVTVGWLLVVAILSSLGGGGIAVLKNRSSPVLKLVGGLAGGVLLTSLIVLGSISSGSPQLINIFSVFGTGIVGGYAGTLVLDWVWEQIKSWASAHPLRP